MTDYISTFIDLSRLVFWGRGALDVLGSQQDRPSHTCERHLSRQLRCSFQTKGGNKMATNNKPTHTLRCRNIKATIWQNLGEKGPFFATTWCKGATGTDESGGV